MVVYYCSSNIQKCKFYELHQNPILLKLETKLWIFNLWKVVLQKCCRDRRELPASLAQAASLTATQNCRFFHLKRARDSICLVCRMGSPNDASFNWFREWTDLGVSHTWSCTFGEENSRTNSEPEAAQALRWLIGLPWYRLPKDLAHPH